MPEQDQVQEAPEAAAEAAPKLVRYRLHVACQINGALQKAGTVVSMPEDWVGPHKAVIASEATLGAEASKGKDVPLYERVPDDEPDAAAASVSLSPEVQQAAIGTLEFRTAEQTRIIALQADRIAELEANVKALEAELALQ